jgi:hypothetical protein
MQNHFSAACQVAKALSVLRRDGSGERPFPNLLSR